MSKAKTVDISATKKEIMNMISMLEKLQDRCRLLEERIVYLENNAKAREGLASFRLGSEN